MLETKCLSRIRIVILVLVLFISIGCRTSAEKSEAKIPGGMDLESLSVDPRCAIVIGRVRIEDDGKNITRKTELYWRRIDGGVDPNNTLYAYAVRSDTGYIITSLPLGKYKLVYANNRNKFEIINPEDPPLPEDLEFEISSNQSVHYLGDMSVHWKKDPEGSRKKAAVIGSVTVGVLTAGYYLPEFGPKDGPPMAEVEIADELAATKAYFDSKFPGSNLPVEKVRWPERYGFN